MTYSGVTSDQKTTATLLKTCVTCSSTGSLHTARPNAPKADGLLSMVYYLNWAVYGRNFLPENIGNPERFTHILYGFAKKDTDGTVSLSDPYADLEKSCGKSDGTGGCIAASQELKKGNSKLKTLLSIGGWGYFQAGRFGVASTSARREKSAESAVALAEQHQFDGIDIDWEYPQDDIAGENFLELLRVTRTSLDASSISTPLMTVAISPNAERYSHLKIKEMDGVLDYWLLMGYDYSGSFNKTTAHSANVYPSTSNPLATPFNTHEGLEAYMKSGVPSNKIILGMPLYGHDFVGTDGLGQPFSTASLGSWPDPADKGPTGVWDYKVSMPICYRDHADSRY